MSTTPQQAQAEVRAARRRMPSRRTHVTVDAEVDVDEVISQLSVEELRAALEARGGASMLAVYEEFRRRGDAPQCLKDVIYEQLGRIL